MKYLLYVLIVCWLPVAVKGQSVSEKMKRYQDDSSYKCGKACAFSYEEADRAALENLVSQISVSVSASFSESESQIDSGDQTDYQRNIDSRVRSFSFGTLPNVGQIIDESDPDEVCVLRYVKVAELEGIFKERENKILDFIASGMEGEKRLQIDVALRYYNWALTLLIAHPKSVYQEIDGKRTNLKVWLDTKINNIFNTLKVGIGECTETDNPIDRYDLCLHFSYMDQEVSDLDFHYFNGERYVGPCKVHKGMAILNFERLPQRELRLRYDYKFENQAKNFDPELRAVLETVDPQNFPNASVSLPVKDDKNKPVVSAQVRMLEARVNAASKAAVASIAPPIVAPDVVRLKLKPLANSADFAGIMKQVETTVRNGTLGEVRALFTPEGYELFDQMLSIGGVSVVGEPVYTFYDSGGPYIIGKSLPLNFKFKGRGNSFMEDVAFRFNKEHKIASVAFTLTKRAEDDIFKAASKWGEASRYAIMSFMEDYQTAYALKRIDYIKSIFSDDAIIITGVVCQAVGKGFFQEGADPLPGGKAPTVRYNRYTKGEYIDKLQRSFASKDFIHLVFEDNAIKKINTNGVIDGESYGIQIKQSYFSDNYADTGYLMLMLDMRGEYPMIRVRAWIPEKSDDASLDKFLNRFRLGGN